MMEMNTNICIAVIDSGIKSSLWPDRIMNGISINVGDDGDISLSPDTEDKIGHGTAVAYSILEFAPPNTRLYPIRIYEADLSADELLLTKALELIIDKKIPCDMVSISSGTVFSDNLPQMRQAIARIREKGILVFAAYDNDGAISWPAAMNEVIGTSVSDDGNEFVCADGSGRCEVCLKKKYYRVPWINPSKNVVAGSSFASAEICGRAASLLYEDPNCRDKEIILRKLQNQLGLQERRNQSNKYANPSLGKVFVSKIQKAILFPWNKEMRPLIAFEDMLPFTIEGIYDSRYSFNIGKTVEDDIKNQSTITIKREDQIPWDNDFDTVVLGHLGELCRLTHTNYYELIYSLCNKWGKKIYAFEEYKNNHECNVSCFTPVADENDLDITIQGKLYQRTTPVLGVFGTGSQQGKFFLQCQLKKRFQQLGYQIGQVATEPNGYLLGADAVYPCGYQAAIPKDPYKAISLVSEYIWEATRDDTCDLVIVGGQSGVVPFSSISCKQYNFPGHILLSGSMPDVYILCINSYDPIEYIKRSIQYLESFSGCPVVGLAMLPIVNESLTNVGLGYREKTLDQSEANEIAKQLSILCGIPCVLTNKSESIDKLIELVLSEIR